MLMPGPRGPWGPGQLQRGRSAPLAKSKWECRELSREPVECVADAATETLTGRGHGGADLSGRGRLHVKAHSVKKTRRRASVAPKHCPCRPA